MKKSPRVREPVQVYLDQQDRRRLDRLVEQLEVSKSDVLRRGLAALDDRLGWLHPLMELAREPAVDQGPPVDYDVVLEHDRAIADHIMKESERKGGKTRVRRQRPHG